MYYIEILYILLYRIFGTITMYYSCTICSRGFFEKAETVCQFCTYGEPNVPDFCRTVSYQVFSASCCVFLLRNTDDSRVRTWTCTQVSRLAALSTLSLERERTLGMFASSTGTIIICTVPGTGVTYVYLFNPQPT